jgi:type VI protein secretion system component VasF
MDTQSQALARTVRLLKAGRLQIMRGKGAIARSRTVLDHAARTLSDSRAAVSPQWAAADVVRARRRRRV